MVYYYCFQLELIHPTEVQCLGLKTQEIRSGGEKIKRLNPKTLIRRTLGIHKLTGRQKKCCMPEL